MASPADHQTGLQKAMIILKNPFPHPAENPPGVQIRPVAVQKENIMQKAQAKSVLILLTANLMASVQEAVSNAAALAVAIKKPMRQKGLTVAVHLMAMRMAIRNHLHREINHIQAG